MNNHNSELKYTVGRIDQLPYDGIKQIALSGRSNVGKSSLINSLLNRNKLARVSSTPGKTITINMYYVDKSFYFADLPGYGFAKRPLEEKAQWSKLVDGYFASQSENPTIAAVIQLIDLKVGPTADDIQMLEYLNYAEIPYFIVATKADKLNISGKKTALKQLVECPYIKEDTVIIPFSSLKGIGIGEVWSQIKKYL